MQLDEVLALDLRPRALREPVPTDLRVGMIGLGRFVNNNVLPAYLGRGVNVVAAADPEPAARERVQRQFGLASTYADYREMLDRERLDVVDINLRWDRGMSPERVVAVREAASRGIHVQIAKPFAETYEQCVQMVEAAEAAGIKLAVNQNSRYAPAYYAIGELIRRGVLGPLIGAGIQWDAARGIQHRPDFDAVHDVTVHQVDILMSWFEREPELVFANQTRKTEAGSVVAATLVFEDGSSGVIRDDFASELRRSWPVTAVGELGSVDGTDDIEIPEPGQPRMARSSLRVGIHALPGVSIDLPLMYRYAPDVCVAMAISAVAPRALTVGLWSECASHDADPLCHRGIDPQRRHRPAVRYRSESGTAGAHMTIDPGVGEAPAPPRQPRYRSIAAEIGRRIESRGYEPGSMLPSEAELAAEFNVTRMTVRQALAGLSARGLIERRHGHGTMVSPIHLQRQADQPNGLSAELVMRGVVAGSRVLRLDKIRPAADARADLWIGPRGSAHRLRRLRYADGVLIGLQETLIPEKYAPSLGEVDFNTASLTSVLRDLHGLSATYADLTIESVGADRAIAAALDVEPGTPVLSSTRVSFLEDGRPLERTLGWFLGSRYSYQIRQGAAPSRRSS